MFDGLMCTKRKRSHIKFLLSHLLFSYVVSSLHIIAVFHAKFEFEIWTKCDPSFQAMMSKHGFTLGDNNKISVHN